MLLLLQAPAIWLSGAIWRSALRQRLWLRLLAMSRPAQLATKYTGAATRTTAGGNTNQSLGLLDRLLLLLTDDSCADGIAAIRVLVGGTAA